MSAQENDRKVALGGLLHRISSFDPKLYQSDFNSRLVLQKTIYLMQEFGLNIGYSFSWYLRGPYSPNLTRDAYDLAKSYIEMPPVKFANPDMEHRFCRFLDFINPISRDPYYLEKIAVVHFLHSMYHQLGTRVVFNKVNAKIPSVTYDDFQEIIGILKSHNLLGNT